MAYYFVEYNGFNGEYVKKCESKEELIVTISKSNAGEPAMLIEGREIKMEWSKMKRKPYWDKTKPLKIPELGIFVLGEKGGMNE